MRRIVWMLSALAIASQALASLETPAPIRQAPAQPAITTTVPNTEEVVVEAPEPRYVAPTLRDRIGRIWAPVYLNGKGPFRLVLDTGANSSAVVNSVAEALGIAPNTSRRAMLHGVTGSAIVPLIDIDRIEVGDLLFEAARVPIVADVFGGADGILGIKGLSDKRIFIDFRHDLIRITQSHGERAPRGFSRVPLTFARNQLPMFDMRIGRTRIRAILDTGAQQTIGNTAMREALLKREREVRTQNIVGVTLDVAQGDSIPTPPIQLGAFEVRNMRITFGDMFIFEQWKMTQEPALLIGMDVIGSLDTVIIDYKLKEMQLLPRKMQLTEASDSRPLAPPPQ